MTHQSLKEQHRHGQSRLSTGHGIRVQALDELSENNTPQVHAGLDNKEQ